MEDYQKDDCSLLLALKVLGKKWTIFVLSELLMERELHFSELQKNIKGKLGESISSRVLSDCLNSLESYNIVKKEVNTESRPIRVKYSLTERGEDFRTVFAVFKGWGIKWGGLAQKKCLNFNCIHNTVPVINIDEAQKLLLYKADPNLVMIDD